MSLPTFSTSVITPTTKMRFTFAPSGVTTYEGARSPTPSTSRFASLYSEAKSRQATSRIMRDPPGLEHLPRLRLYVDLEDLRRLDDHHEAVVVRGHVPAHLDWLGDDDVRELVPHDVRRHRLLRLGDARVEGLVQQGLRELSVEDRRQRAGAVIEDRLDAQIRLAFHLAVDAARAFPEHAPALRAPIHEPRPFAEVDQDPSHGDVGPAAALREVLDPHPRAKPQLRPRRQEVRLEPRDRRAFVEADLRDAPPRLHVRAFDPQHLVLLQPEVLPRAELRLARFVRQDAREDGFRRAVHLDLAPLDGEDARGDGDVRSALAEVDHADRGRLAGVRQARRRLVLRQRIRGFLPHDGPHAEVDLHLAAILLRIRVLHADHVAFRERHRKRLPPRERHRRGRVAEDPGQDPLGLLALRGDLLLVDGHDADEQVHALFAGAQLPDRLAHADREAAGVPPVLLDDRPLRRVQRNAVDVQVARQLPLDLLRTHLVSERPGDVMDMGRQFLLHRSHVPEACLFLASSSSRGPSYLGVRRGR